MFASLDVTVTSRLTFFLQWNPKRQKLVFNLICLISPNSSINLVSEFAKLIFQTDLNLFIFTVNTYSSFTTPQYLVDKRSFRETFN
jgi:hypothetical protein